LSWSIIDLAREHSKARISRQQGGHCRWQVAAGGGRMWPTCAINAVVLGAVRWRSPGVVNVDTPAPASCMESLPGCDQNSGRLLSVSQKSRNEKYYLRELLVNRDYPRTSSTNKLATRRPADPSTRWRARETHPMASCRTRIRSRSRGSARHLGKVRFAEVLRR
jgi:hypothetical protein